MLPFFLHLGVHDKEGVMGEVDRDLAFGIAIISGISGIFVTVVVVVIEVSWRTTARCNPSHSKLPLNTKT